jgi:hypothetical protein
VRGDLVWTILDNGSWAIPIKRGRGSNMTGLLVMWLSRKPNGWVPEVEEGLGQLSPLPGTSGKPLKSLQRARVSGCCLCAVLALFGLLMVFQQCANVFGTTCVHKQHKHWVPEVEEGLGQLPPLPHTTSGKQLRSLQQAQVSECCLCAFLALFGA